MAEASEKDKKLQNKTKLKGREGAHKTLPSKASNLSYHSIEEQCTRGHFMPTYGTGGLVCLSTLLCSLSKARKQGFGRATLELRLIRF